MVSLVGKATLAIEYIIRAEEQQPGAILFRRARDARCALTVYVKRQFPIGLAAIHVSVGCGEHNPLWLGLLNCARDLLRVANVGILRAQTGDLIMRPLTHEFFT
jgi:hypothetical protein